MSEFLLPVIPMVPGPVSVPEHILRAQCADHGAGRKKAEFLPLHNATAAKIAQILDTKNDVIIMTGEGMLALWGALKSCLHPGEKVLCLSTGVFGEGMADMAESFGCETRLLSLPFNESLIDLAPVEAAIKEFRPKMITMVHCETPSGTINPLHEIGALKKQYGVPLLYVDAVASAGGMPVNADACHVDLLLGGSQKCLSAPAALSFVAVSDTAWEYIEDIAYEGYDAFLPFKTMQTTGLYPYTPYWHGQAGLDVAAQSLLDEGLEAVYARHAAVAEQCRQGLARLGIELWAAPGAVLAPTVTAALVPARFGWDEWYKRLRLRGLGITGSFGPMDGKVFRLGHMGSQADPVLMDKALAVLEDALNA